MSKELLEKLAEFGASNKNKSSSGLNGSDAVISISHFTDEEIEKLKELANQKIEIGGQYVYFPKLGRSMGSDEGQVPIINIRDDKVIFRKSHLSKLLQDFSTN